MNRIQSRLKSNLPSFVPTKLPLSSANQARTGKIILHELCPRNVQKE